MKLRSRLLCLLLAAMLSVTLLSGCGVIKGDTVMELNGYKITEAMYSYWMSRYKTAFLQTFNNSKDTESFWDSAAEDGRTYGEYVTDYVNSFAREVLISMKLFDDYGLTFTSDEKSAVTEYVRGLNSAYGSKAELNEYLADYGLNAATLERIYYAELKVDKVKEELFGDGGIFAVTDDEKKEYYEKHYYCAEWILVYPDKKLKTTVDENGETVYYTDESGNYVTVELTDAEKVEKAARIEELRGKLSTEDFKKLRAEYSDEELSKYEYYTDGIFLSANDYKNYGTELIKKISETEIGEISELTVEGALFIIKRYELKDHSDLTTQELNLMVDFDSYAVNDKMTSYYAAFDIKTNDDVLGRFDIKEWKALTNTNV